MKDNKQFDFGTWVIVDFDQNDKRQVIQWDPLNREYTLDKNGVWEQIADNRVIEDTY